MCQSHFLGTTVKEKQDFQNHSDETGSMCAPCAEVALPWREQNPPLEQEPSSSEITPQKGHVEGLISS